jgi:hypothetical protein
MTGFLVGAAVYLVAVKGNAGSKTAQVFSVAAGLLAAFLVTAYVFGFLEGK